MNKELEAWERIKATVERSDGDADITKLGDLDIIETTLKRLEKIDNPEIVGTTTVDEALKQFLIQQCPDVEKKLKALEIIKESIPLRIVENGEIAQLVLAGEGRISPTVLGYVAGKDRINLLKEEVEVNEIDEEK